MNNVVTASLLQVLFQAPILIAYIAGFVLALAFWRRCPTSCLLVLIAVLLSFLVTVANPFVTQYILTSRIQMGWSYERLNSMFSVASFASSLIHAAAVALFLAAIFIDRRSRIEK